ncbi:ABC transporter ATP-binding protein [Paenibacillus sp. MMS20-IR301]|uniref:ABC transporter ATP-binding protein n=1 Tax=Paenibacillus sp. MMS20-IR301 TaxID=2895946 RepID=UPI0028E4C360|nr:ABC transporter ATP-binding protein [Paenibacillus sp. MMS20-IR301]WNS45215.1 ABC transporter ATP-binding protein [Paenibacillus sp. MMS20-IR301]
MKKIRKQRKDRVIHSAEMTDVPKNSKATIKRLLELLMLQKGPLSLIVFATFVSIGLYTVTPLILGRAIDQLIEGIQEQGLSGGFGMLYNTIGASLLLLVGFYMLSAGFSFIQEYTMASVGERLVLSLRKKMSEKITKLPLSYYDSRQTGDLLSRVTNDLDKVAEVLKTGSLQFMNAIFNITLSVILMLTQSSLLTVLILVSLSISVFATKWISGKNYKVASENQTVLGELNGKIEEYYTGNLIIKSFNQQEQITETMREISQRQYSANKKSQFVLYAIYPAIRFLTQLAFVVTAVVGGIFAVNGRITIGTIQAFLQYVNQISDPITQSSYFLNSLQSALASAERVFEFLDEPEEVQDTDSPKLISSPQGAVSFEHVQFGYHPDKLLMQDISFKVEPNQMVAIVGPTGAGKTTLINLLMRFYELNGGRILIDGTDIKELPKSGLRTMIGMVLQDTWLFKGTIAQNIAYGKMNASRDEIIQAAKAARCDAFIRTLEHGYDTIISSETGSISQGQMQLLTIARAMLADPALMILDEATSSVDTRTEVEIQKAMAEMMKGKTSFVIAHRLSTIRSADIILVMKNGTIIETGTHEELLAGETFYADLYNSQFANGGMPA